MNAIMPKQVNVTKKWETVLEWFVQLVKDKHIERFNATGIIQEQEKDKEQKDNDFFYKGQYIPTLNGNFSQALKKIRLDYDKIGNVIKSATEQEKRKEELLNEYGFCVEYLGPKGYYTHFADSATTQAATTTSATSTTTKKTSKRSKT